MSIGGVYRRNYMHLYCSLSYLLMIINNKKLNWLWLCAAHLHDVSLWRRAAMPLRMLSSIIDKVIINNVAVQYKHWICICTDAAYLTACANATRPSLCRCLLWSVTAFSCACVFMHVCVLKAEVIVANSRCCSRSLSWLRCPSCAKAA